MSAPAGNAARAAREVRATQDRSVTPTRAILLGLVLVLPPTAGLVWLHAARHGALGIWTALDALAARPLVGLVVVLGGAAVHEVIHALAWAATPTGAWRHVHFGWQWRSLVPYAHYAAPLPATAYRIGAAAPLVVLGILPALVGTFAGVGALAAFGWLFVLGAAGDVAVLWLLRGVPGGAQVEDHPSRAGCLVREEASSRP
ncbi:MAG TPA: DUF3267 domain-containing protein [Gemmatimonadales bacterium]|nr:DUF3267 domain-containing protein [Gemmatimonadales bacterium]